MVVTILAVTVVAALVATVVAVAVGGGRAKRLPAVELIVIILVTLFKHITISFNNTCLIMFIKLRQIWNE